MFTPHRISLRLVIGLVAVAGLLACDSLTGPEPPDRPAFRTGTLMGIDVDILPWSTRPVEKPNLWIVHPTSNGECRMSVHFLEDPEIFFRVSSDRYLRAAHTDLEIGMHLELWIPPGTGVEDVCHGVLAPSHIVASMPG